MPVSDSVNDFLNSLSESGSYIYNDVTCVFYLVKDVHKIQDILKKKFSTSCKWFFDIRLSIHFWEDKTKCILLRSSKLNISYGDHIVKRYHTVEYLECQLDSNLSAESMAMKVF